MFDVRAEHEDLVLVNERRRRGERDRHRGTEQPLALVRLVALRRHRHRTAVEERRVFLLPAEHEQHPVEFGRYVLVDRLEHAAHFHPLLVADVQLEHLRGHRVVDGVLAAQDEQLSLERQRAAADQRLVVCDVFPLASDDVEQPTRRRDHPLPLLDRQDEIALPRAQGEWLDATTLNLWRREVVALGPLVRVEVPQERVVVRLRVMRASAENDNGVLQARRLPRANAFACDLASTFRRKVVVFVLGDELLAPPVHHHVARLDVVEEVRRTAERESHMFEQIRQDADAIRQYVFRPREHGLEHDILVVDIQHVVLNVMNEVFLFEFQELFALCHLDEVLEHALVREVLQLREVVQPRELMQSEAVARL